MTAASSRKGCGLDGGSTSSPLHARASSGDAPLFNAKSPYQLGQFGYLRKRSSQPGYPEAELLDRTFQHITPPR